MTAIALILGAGVGFGVLLVVSGLHDTGGVRPAQRHFAIQSRHFHQRVGLALGAAAFGGLLTRWPVAVVGAGLLGAFLPDIIGGEAARARVIARTDAVATWAELLRDSLSGAHGLEEVIVVTAPIAPAPIRDEVLLLAARVGHDRLPMALRRFADDLADPTADLVVAALVVAAEGSTRELGDLLGTLAASARDEAAMRRRVDASRARARSTVQIVTGVTAVMITGFLLFDRGYLAPYDEPLGQLVLALVAGFFGVGLWWLARMARIPAPERFLVVPSHEEVGR